MDKARVDGKANTAIAENDSFEEQTASETTNIGVWKEQLFNALSENILATERSHWNEPAIAFVSH